MEHLEQVVVDQQPGQRREIGDRERVDTGAAIFAGDLDQREYRVVSAFADELGIDRAVAGSAQRRAEPRQFRVAVDVDEIAGFAHG